VTGDGDTTSDLNNKGESRKIDGKDENAHEIRKQIKSLIYLLMIQKNLRQF
jgi:hypothetical protein